MKDECRLCRAYMPAMRVSEDLSGRMETEEESYGICALLLDTVPGKWKCSAFKPEGGRNEKRGAAES